MGISEEVQSIMMQEGMCDMDVMVLDDVVKQAAENPSQCKKTQVLTSYTCPLDKFQPSKVFTVRKNGISAILAGTTIDLLLIY